MAGVEFRAGKMKLNGGQVSSGHADVSRIYGRDADIHGGIRHLDRAGAASPRQQEGRGQARCLARRPALALDMDQP